MIIDFASMQDTVLHEFNGGTKDFVSKMYKDDSAKILLGSLEPGASIGMHKHETSSEMIFILEGQATIIYDDNDENEILNPSMCHYCPKGHSHLMMNKSDKMLRFFAVVPESM